MAMRARFEIQQKLRRQKKHEKKRQKEEKQKRSSLRNKRGKQQDKTKTQAMDEYKARRSAGKIILCSYEGATKQHYLLECCVGNVG